MSKYMHKTKTGKLFICVFVVFLVTMARITFLIKKRNSRAFLVAQW